jgi:hypothetical protein
VFGFFAGSKQKKTQFKLQPRQEVEVELQVGNGVYEAYFVQVQEVHKKRVVLQIPGSERKPMRVGDGQAVTISTLIDDNLLSYQGFVMGARDRDFDVNYPPKDKDVVDCTFPPRDDDFRIEVNISVEFRAMSTAHTQVAKTHSVTRNGLFLLTNLPIPKATSLLMEVEIPNGSEINTKGKALSSVEDSSSGRRQYITEVEFDADITEKDRAALIRYAMFFKSRQDRADKRAAEGTG